jgi:hypothetical protein
LLSPANAQTVARGLRDGAGLFDKKEVVEQINAQIEDIYHHYGKDVLIETVRTIPPEGEAELKHHRAARFFENWADERAVAAGVDGIYILICQEPRHIEVAVRPKENLATFDKRTRERLRKTLEHKLQGKWPEALGDTVALVGERLGSKEEEANRGGWGWILAVIGGILGAWVLIALVRRFQGGKAVAPPSVVSSGALAGESIYRAMSEPPPTRAIEPEPTVRADAPTLSYHGRPEDSPAGLKGTEPT